MGPVWLYNLSPSLADDDHSKNQIYEDNFESDGLELSDDDWD